MRLSWVGRAFAIAVAVGVLSTGCSNDASPPGEVDAASPSLSFDVPGGILTATPGEIVDVSVSAKGGISSVALALDGNYGDASLDRTSSSVEGDHATFKLRAPTAPAAFSVLASAGLARARLDVSVSRDGFATVRVTPSYKGKRPVPIVAASTFFSKCSDLGSFPAKDGAPLVVGTNGETLVIPKVPAGSNLAVAVRIARYATGCVDVETLAPDAIRDVTVPIYDLPLAVASIDVVSSFSFTLTTTDRSALASALSPAIAQTLAGFFPDSEGKRLLDAMADATGNPNDKGAFLAKRTQAGWDATVTSWLGAHGATMQSRTSGWLNAALPKVPGDLSGRLTGSGVDKATFVPSTFGAADATTSASVPGPFTIVADTDDTLKLTGSVSVSPSRLLAGAAGTEAKADAPSATSVPVALATLIDCTGLATTLASGAYAYGTCDATCAASLCKKALVDHWEAALVLADGKVQKLDVKVTASAGTQFDERAVPTSYSGTWVGQLGSGIAAKGNATGAPPPPN